MPKPDATSVAAASRSAAPAPAILAVSPHADDVVFSCGGSVARDVASGRRVIVVTVFNSESRPGRNADDRQAVEGLGAEFQVLGLDHAAWRGPRYRRLEGLLRPIGAPERGMVREVRAGLSALLPADAELILPLGAGGHVDHQICHEAGRLLVEPGRLWFYEDMPYALCPYAVGRRLAALGGHGDCARATRPGELLAGLRYFVPSRWPRVLDMTRGARIALAQNRHWRADGPTPWRGEQVDVRDFMDAKLAAIACYRAEWENHFASLEAWRAAYARYARSIGASFDVERRWRPAEPDARGGETQVWKDDPLRIAAAE